MKTITFYSYKGGVGRTLALANIAIYLTRFGQNVCVMDFDLEAPGLHYKFPQYLRSDEIKNGLVDYIYSYVHNGFIPKSIIDFSRTMTNPSESLGGLSLIPAGNVLSSDYWQKLASIDWHDLFYKENSDGILFFLDLKVKIKNELNPDFLLIDSRTGITEMSGLCTSLLADKIVYLIVNNQENIEGARQILRGINKSRILAEQEPIDVTLALTRIPFRKDEREKEVEYRIINEIRNILIQTNKELEDKIKVKDICILHSDRDLELSESLRMNQEGITQDSPLVRDYLRLFSNVIPEEVILPKLDSVLEQITASSNILDEPDRTQQQLEGLVASYRLPKTLSKLIDFYFLRNEKNDKILTVFHELWNTYEIEDKRMLSKYVSRFMGKGMRYREDMPKFDLAIIEKYLSLNPDNETEVEIKVARVYTEDHRYDKALEHYFRLLEKVKEKNEIIDQILDIYLINKDYIKALELFKKYYDIVEKDISLRTKKIGFLYRTGDMEELQKILADATIENVLFANDVVLYADIMERLDQFDKVEDKLRAILEQGLRTGGRHLLEAGRYFYKLGKQKEFKNRIVRHPEAKAIQSELDRLYR